MALSDYPINCQCSPHTETSQSICCANHLTGFHMRATLLTINGLKANVKQNETKELVVRSTYFQTLKCNVKNTCIFHLISVGIPSGLTSSVSNRGGGINSTNKIH